jgi:hypothetical protein
LRTKGKKTLRKVRQQKKKKYKPEVLFGFLLKYILTGYNRTMRTAAFENIVYSEFPRRSRKV